MTLMQLYKPKLRVCVWIPIKERSIISKGTGLASSTRVLRPTVSGGQPPNPKPAYDMFINHRGSDTKKTIAGLLFKHLSSLGYNPFLDSKSMKPGDRLFEEIDPAIKNCRVGVAVFSKHYCNSYFCLHELALMMECQKKVVPIFCDVKPSELRIKEHGEWTSREVERFNEALEEAKHTVGLAFDTLTGDWSEFLTNATNAILHSLVETQEEENYFKNKITKYYDGNSAENSY